MGSNFAHRRARLLLLAAILLISGLTLSSFLARQRLRRRVGEHVLPPKIAADVDQQTQAFSLSKTLGGQALYNIQASQVTNFKDTGKTILHHVSIQIFGKKGDRQDHITSQECEFDAATGSLFIPGEVQMELQGSAPVSEGAAAPQAAKPEPPAASIHIVTSGLLFNQKTGVASTAKQVQFRFAGGEGTSQGAVYNPQDQSITLKAQAQFTLWKTPGAQQKSGATGSDAASKPGAADRQLSPSEEDLTHVRAASLRFQRAQHTIFLTAPVEISQGTRKVEAGNSEVLLDARDRAQRASLAGPVHATVRGPLRLTEVRAGRAELEFTPRGKVRRLVLDGTPSGGGAAMKRAAWATASARSLKTGQAEQVEMLFDESTGHLRQVNADGQVRVVFNPVKVPEKLPLLRPNAAEPTPGDGSRVLAAQQVAMILYPDGATLHEVRTHSASSLQLFPAKPGEDRRTVQGVNFDMQFDAAGNLSEFTADGKVRLIAEAVGSADPRKRVSTSDHLWAAFNPHTHDLSKTRQWGNFYYQDANRHARGDRADYNAKEDVIVLRGNALVWNAGGKISAQKISLANATGEVTAEGRVATTNFPAASPGNPNPEPVHVVADRLQYNFKTQHATYQGNARLWQGNNLIEATWLDLDRPKQQLLARNVYSIFSARPDSGKERDRKPMAHPVALQDNSPVEIRSKRLSYRQGERKAVYQGNVSLSNSSATMSSDELEILFPQPPTGSHAAPSEASWQIERAIARGSVKIVQPGREATGEEADYIPAEKKVILLGNLATISDVHKGSTQGVRLTYFTGDGRILVQGKPGSPAETWRRAQR